MKAENLGHSALYIVKYMKSLVNVIFVKKKQYEEIERGM